MKRTDLMKKLQEIGEVELVREGGQHTIYRVGGNLVSVPRHREMNELTAKGIIRDAGKVA